MSTTAQGATTWSSSPLPDDPYIPQPVIVRTIEPESPGVATICVEFQDPRVGDGFRHLPGQFNMVGRVGVGEVPISISGAAHEGPGLRHTIRFVGRVTDTLRDVRPGSVLTLRGPFGSHWPVEEAKGRDVVLVAGGLGLAPLRPAVKALLADRERFGRLTLIYGARQPADILFPSEHTTWQAQGMDVLVTVDRADADWRGLVGVAPALLRTVAFESATTLIMTCGPEVMMRYTIRAALARGLSGRDVYLSLERNMQCAVGLCGHCQLGPLFLCTNGPVFAFDSIARFFGTDHF